ncbi:MAG: hypothetical protein K0T99_02870 [Alphaproteobacteria bacterium]|nr:hypothetical protein [Alphaproteobacteria bacterium]
MFVGEAHCQLKKHNSGITLPKESVIQTEHCASFCTSVITLTTLAISYCLNAHQSKLGIFLTALAVGAGATEIDVSCDTLHNDLEIDLPLHPDDMPGNATDVACYEI